MSRESSAIFASTFSIAAATSALVLLTQQLNVTLTFAWRRIAKHALSAVSVTANLTEKERKDYSLCKFILHGAEPQAYEAGLEAEISRSIEARIGKATSGFYVPTR